MLYAVPPRRDAAGQQTGARILDAALELFDRDGTSRVTTNHIAAHLGISPGNLYYWYRDKQAIVRALWARSEARRTLVSEPADVGADSLPAPADVLERLVATAAPTCTFLFLARDGTALAHLDPQLRADMAAARTRRVRILSALARTWRADGVLRPVADDRVDDLVDAMWTLTETWPARVAASRSGGAATRAPGAADDGLERVLRAVLEPYLA